MKEEFEKQLKQKDEIILGLENKVKENLYSIDAQAQYNRSENIKIYGIENTKGEDTNKILWCSN